MNILLFFIANLMVLGSAIIFSSRFKLNTISDKVLTVFVLSISQIILTQLFLGVVVKRLYYPELLLLNLLILAVAFAANRKKILTGKMVDIKGIDFRMLLKELVKSPLVTSLALISLILISIIVYLGLNLPPNGWDEIWYHLTAVASWYQEGRIFMLPAPSIWTDVDFISKLTEKQMAYHMSVGGFWYNVYPMNSELISLWNIIFLGNDRIVDLTQLPFTLIGVAAIYSLARKLGLRERASATAGLMFLMTPIVIIQSRTAYVDITFGVLTIIAANFLVGFILYKNRHYAIMTAITVGIGLGTKASGIVFAIVFAAGLLLVDFINNKESYNLKKLVCFGATISGIIVLLGGFWYIRNLYYYGNPIFPYKVELAGFTLFKGLGTVESLIMTHNTPPEYFRTNYFVNVLTSWFEREPYYSVDIRKAGFGALWAVIQVPAILLALIYAIKEKSKPFLVFVSIFAVLFIVHPSNWWTRYTIFIIALGAISVLYLLENFGRFSKLLVSVAIVLLSSYTVFTSIPYLGIADLREDFKKTIEERTIGATSYSDFLWVDGIAKDSTIATAPMTFIYPLFSQYLDKKVYIVDARTQKEWIDKINQSGAEYVTFLKGYLYYKKWVDNNPGKFTQLYDGHTLQVYKVNKAGEVK